MLSAQLQLRNTDQNCDGSSSPRRSHQQQSPPPQRRHERRRRPHSHLPARAFVVWWWLGSDLWLRVVIARRRAIGIFRISVDHWGKACILLSHHHHTARVSARAPRPRRLPPPSQVAPSGDLHGGMAHRRRAAHPPGAEAPAGGPEGTKKRFGKGVERPSGQGSRLGHKGKHGDPPRVVGPATRGRRGSAQKHS